MLLTLWNYLIGYVIIEISGFSIERFLNLTIKNGINVENLEKTKDGVKCKVLASDFKKLKTFSRKTKSKLKIKEKHGLPFLIFKNKKRKLFFGGILVFIGILYYLSSFIWTIDIIGNNYIDNNSILRFCEENGFHIGSYKKNIKIKDLEKALKNNFKDLSWITIQIKGTSAKIKLVENIPKNEIEENKFPSNIIAKTDAIITEIITRKGTPLVKKGDFVKKDEVIVSGELLIKDGEEVKDLKFVNSDADVRAKSWHNFSVEVPFKYNVKEYTKKLKLGFELIIFNKKFNMDFFKNKSPYKNYDKFTSIKQLKLSENFSLPFIIVINKYKEYNIKEKMYSLEEAKNIANNLITEKIIKGFPISTDILDKKVSFEEKDDKVIGKAELTIIQDIGINQKIENIKLLEGEIENGAKENNS